MSQSFYDRTTSSKFYELGDKLGDIIILSFFWFLCSIPIVTMGTASSALYYAVHKRFKDHSTTPGHDFWHSFKQNLPQGVALNLVLLLYGGLTIFNLIFAIWGFRGISMPSWYAPVAVFLLLPFLCAVPYTFAYLARFKNTFKNTLFHSFTFSTMYPGHMFLMWLYMIVSLAVMIAFFPSILFLPFTCCYLCRRCCEKDFNYALLMKDKREHPENYREEMPATDEEEDDEESDEEETDSDDDYEDVEGSDENLDEDDESDDADEDNDSGESDDIVEDEHSEDRED